MTKLLYAFVFCLLLPYSASSQMAGETNQYKSKGPVRSVRIETCTISERDGDLIENTRVLSAEYTFNPSGQLVESRVHNYDGSLYAKYQAVYRNKLKAEETYYKPNGDLMDRMVYSYGSNDRLVEKTVEKAKKSPSSKSVFDYDDKGGIIEKVHKNIKDSGGYKVIYAYDDAQMKIEETAYDLKGSLISRTTSSYDKQWRLIEKEIYLKQGSRLWKSSFVHDANGNISEETFNILGAVSKWRYGYQVDSYNNWTKRTTYSLVNKNGSLRFEPVEATYRAITYDAAGNGSQVSTPEGLAWIVATKETNSYLPGDANKRKQPIYPEEAMRRRLTGKTNAYVLVDETGKVISARAAQDQPQSLRDAAAAAAWDWKFNPTISGGIAIKLVVSLTFTFTP